MIKLACTDVSLNSHYGLSIVLFTFGLDWALVLLSYVLIFRSVLAIASLGDRLKTLNTCVSHVLAVLIFYVPMVSVSIVHRFGAGLPHAVHTLMSLIYLFVPPMLNPIISSIRTKEFQCRLFKMLFRIRSWLASLEALKDLILGAESFGHPKRRGSLWRMLVLPFTCYDQTCSILGQFLPGPSWVLSSNQLYQCSLET